MSTEARTLGSHPHEAAHGHAHGAHDQVNAPLRHVLKERLIDLGGMRIELRLIVGLAIAQLLVAGIMVALKDLSGGPFEPTLYAFPSEEGDGVQLISAAAFVIGIVIACAAWAYVLAGAFRAGIVVRVLSLAVFFATFVIERDALDGLGGATTPICIAILAVILLLAIVTWFPERSAHADAEHGLPASPAWRRVRLLMVPLLFVLIGAIYLVVYLASQSADAAANAAAAASGEEVTTGVEAIANSQVAIFSNDVFDQIDKVQYLLIPLLVIAGSDFGEWGQLVIARTARRVRTSLHAAVFAVIALAAAAAIAWDGINTAAGDAGGGAVEELLLAGVVALVAAGLYFLAKPRGGWSSVPFYAIALVAILDVASGFITQQLQGDSEHLNDYIQLASAGLWAAGGLVALMLLAVRRGRMSPGITAGLVFTVLIGVVDLLGSIWVLGNFDNAPLGITADNAPFLGDEGIRAGAAILTGVVVVAAVALRRLRRWAVPISVLLVTTVSLELLSYIDLLYANKGKLEEVSVSGNLAIGGTVILLLALLWDLAVSGEAITNVRGRIFPRDTRVLMFVGYILLVATSVLMFGSLHDEKGKLLESAFDPEEWVKQGILFLGIPLVITLAVAGFHRWRDDLRAVADTAEGAEEAAPA